VKESGLTNLVNFAVWLKREKRNADITIEEKMKIVKRLGKKTNLWDSEAVEKLVQDSEWSGGRKNGVLQAYKDWLEFQGFDYSFEPYPVEPKLPHVPLEKDIDQLIGGFAYSMYAPFLQLAKESGWRPVEIWRLTPEDFDLEQQIVTLNDPAKGSNPRQFKMSDKLTAMITPLIRRSQPKTRIWRANLETIRHNIRRKRKEIAEKLSNPALLRINLKAFRHFKGTMTYHKTKDILYTQKVLGHKQIKSTMVYTHLVNFESDEWTSRVAATIEECCKLVDDGFEYVCDFEGRKVFRKRK